MQATAAEHLYETPLSMDQVITPDKQDGWVRVEATIRDTSQLRWWLLGFGEQVQVLRPSSLRRYVERASIRTYANYQSEG